MLARDVAPLRDERHGWSVAIEHDSGQDLMVVASLGGELVPGRSGWSVSWRPSGVARCRRHLSPPSRKPSVPMRKNNRRSGANVQDRGSKTRGKA